MLYPFLTSINQFWMARHDVLRIRDPILILIRFCYILLFVAKFVATSSSIEQQHPETHPYTYQEPHLEQQIPHFDYYYYHQSQQQQQHNHQSQSPQPTNPAFILTENFNTLNPYQATTTPPLPISTDAITATTTNTDANNVLYHKKDTTSRPPFVAHLSLPTTITTSTSDDIESINSKDHDHDHYSDVDLRGPQPQPTNKCEFWLVSAEGNLTSFGDYSQNVDCVYRVAPLNPTVCSLELHFDDFDVDDQRSENDGHGHGSKSNVEKEFEQLSATPDSCVDNYLEFNNHKRYCRRDWKNRMDIVEIDPNFEKDFMFRLVLDRQTHHSGFNIRYKPLFDTCRSLPKRVDKLKDSDSTLYPVQVSSAGSGYCEQRHDALEFEIKSPDYPKNYSNNLDCVYYIMRKSDDVCGLELKFLHFDVEHSEGCAYDFFEIDGESFCGRLPNGSRNIFRFDSNIKAISFQTDSQMNGPGFWIKIKQVKDCSNAFLPAIADNSRNVGYRMQKCSIVWHERNGQLSSLKYPEPYPNNLLCAYTIEANPGGHYCGLEMNFLNFDLQQSKDCQGDFFELDNQRYCGRQLHQVVKNVSFNKDGFTRFLFKSDSQESRPGFLLNYTQTQCKDVDGVDESVDESKLPIDIGQEKQVQVREPCLQVFQEKRFELVSDTVDGHYKDNQNCRFTIKKYSPKVCYLEMHFRMFDLEASTDCQYDFMEIGNAVRLCGTLNQETSRIYVFDKPEMVVTFHSDSTNERKGYLIDVEQLECEGDRIVRDPSSHTSEDGGLGEGLQSLEQYRFEQQQHQQHQQQEYQGQAPNDTTAADLRQQTQQQQENFVQQSSEFDPTTISRKKHVIQPSSLLCSKTYQEKEFFIHSPGYPGNYPTDLDCLYMILPFSPDVCKLEINFDQFQLQPYDFEKNCLKSDFLDFDNKEQFCGKMPDSQTKLYPMHSNETYFIHFHSDSFRTSFDKGFRLYVRQIECPFSATPTTTKSMGGGGAGFTSQQPQPSQVHCSRIFMSPSFDIQSPLYPAPYPANTYCDYRIVKFKSPGFNVCFLEVHFVEFDLQTSSHCNKDYVSFNGIKICGQVTRDSVRLFPFYENEFTISFYSDPLINGRGFHLKVRQNECPPTPLLPVDNDVVHHQKSPITKIPSSLSSSSSNNDPFSSYQIYQANQRCQQTFGSTYFELESPNYPQYYLPSLGCVFTIQRRHSRFCKLELFFVDFDVEPSTRCVEDYLLVDNVKYCNANRPPTVLQLPFYEPEKRIYFRSVSFRPRKGFLIQARQIDCDTLVSEPKNYLNHINNNPSIQQQQQDIKSRTMSNADNAFMDNSHKFIFLPSLPSICEICVTEVTGHIQSYDYPNYYPPNVNCTYRITPLPDNCMAQLQFEEFDFDFAPECNQDYLEINGVRYCGHQLKGVTLLLLNKRKEDLVIRMVTSSRGAMVKPSFRGFRAGYTQLPCIDKQQMPDPGSNANNQQHPQQVPQIMPATKSVSVHHPGLQGLGQVQHGGPNVIATTTKTTTAAKSETAAKSDTAIYCDQTFDEKIFEIRSPGYPYRYFDDLECSYLIRKNNANVCRLKVTFNYFNVVGEDGNCSGDYLDVFNTRFCGVLDRFSIKEVPFTQEKILLHFHTNHQQTSNGFHLLVEQVDCISVQPLTDTRLPVVGQHRNEPSPSGGHYQPQNHPTQGSMVSKTNHNQNQNRMMAHHHQQQPKMGHPVKGDDGGQIRPQQRDSQSPSSSSFKYDDDEIISEFDTRNKATIDSKAQVIYDDKHGDGGHGGGGSKPEKDRESFQQQPQQRHEDSPNDLLKNHHDHDHHDQPKTINTYPLRYYSHNITVKDEDVNNGQRAESYGTTTTGMMMTTIPTFQQPQNTYHPEQQTTGSGIGYTVDGDNNSADGNRPSTTTTSSVSKLCDQGHVEKVFFELKADDLAMSKNGADCQLTIRKAKSNICQLDLMIIRYNLSDPTCSQQYLAIDGERVCGHIHEGTMKRVWFTKPELFLFVKLNQLDHPINDQTFEIKARQVECTANVDVNQLQQQQQQQQQRGEPPSPAMEIQQQQQRQPSSPSYPRSRPVEQFPIKGQISIEGRGHHSGPARFPQHSREYQPPPPPSMFEWQTITMRPPFPATPTVGNGYSLKQEVSDPPHQQQPEYDRHCDLIENEKQFKIVSPMDRSQTRCRYTIRKANDKVCAIDIKFEMFRLEDSQKCDREFMEIDSGKICGAFPVGHERRYGFQPNEYEKVIYYTTSKSLNKAGDFKLDVKQVEDCDKPPSTPKPTLTMPTVCDISVRNYRGNIKSPNYPAPYGDYTKCVYRIQAIGDDYCAVQLRLRDIDIEQGDRGKCDKDWLQIDSKKFCGNQLVQTEFMVPFENHLGHKVAQIKFVSDAYGNGRGFDIEYKQEPCSNHEPIKPTTSLQSPGQKGLSIESRFRPPKIVAVHNDYHHHHQTPSSSSSSKGGGSSLRPLYPPNYVSKAHMLKTMDRKEFIKMLLLEQEKSKIKMNINHHGSSFVPPATEQQQQQEEEDSLSSTQTETTTNPSMTTDVGSGSSPNVSAEPPSPNGNGQSTTINSIAEETVMFTTMPSPQQTNVEGDGSMNTDTTEDQSNLITTEASITMSDVS